MRQRQRPHVLRRPEPASEIERVGRPARVGDDEHLIAKVARVPRRRFERMGRERSAKDQRRRPEFIELGFEVGADEGARRVADDDDLAVERPDGERERSSGGGWLSADMGQRQTLRPPCGDEGCDVLVGDGASPAAWRGSSIASRASMMRSTASAGNRMVVRAVAAQAPSSQARARHEVRTPRPRGPESRRRGGSWSQPCALEARQRHRDGGAPRSR